MARELLTIKEIAERYMRSTATVYRWKKIYTCFPQPDGMRQVGLRAYAEVYDAQDIARWIQRHWGDSSGQGQGQGQQADGAPVAEEGASGQGTHH